MTAPTRNVTVQLDALGGPAYEGITIRANLDVNELYEGFVIADDTTAVTDATGAAVLAVFPNAPSPTGLGTMGSTYRFRATIPGGRKLDVLARVPDADCFLHDILVDTEGVALDAAELAVLAAQGYAVDASADAAIATAQAGIATTQAGIATTQAGIATTAAGTATTQAAAAEASRDAIDNRIYPGTYAEAPTTRPDATAIQEGDRYYDSVTDNEFISRSGVWVNFESAAAASAASASASAGAASASEGVATDQAVIATAQAVEAAVQATTATAASSAASAAAATSGAYPNSAASNVPRGLTQASVGALTAGTGGTNGTFALAWSVGNFSINPTGTFTVAGGVLTAVTITGPGLYIGAAATVPTPSFAASAGLTGAAVALTAQFLVTAGQGYWVQSTDGATLDRYTNTASVATRDTGVESIPTILFDADDDFPGTRSLYGPIFTPRVKDLSASNFATEFPADAEWTVSAGTANDYTATISDLVVGEPFIIYIRATDGVLGTMTFTHNGAKTLTEMRRGLWMWEGTAEATTATIVVKNGSASGTLTGYVRYAIGAVAAGDDPEEASAALESFFDAGMPASDEELLRANPVFQGGSGVPAGTAFMGLEATSGIIDVTTPLADVALGDTIVVLAHAEMLNGDDAAMNEVTVLVTATTVVTYSLKPLAEHPGWWYGKFYLDPAAYASGTITQIRTNASNKNNSNHYNETARYVSSFIYKNHLPTFYASAGPDEGKGIQHVGNMRSRTYATTAVAEYTGYLKALYGSVRRLWIRSSAGGDYLVVRKNPDTGDFIGSALSITHPGGGAGNEWQDFTSSIPAAWKRPQETGFVVGIAPDPSGTPGLVEYGSSVVGDAALNATSWKSGTADGDDLTLFAGVGERFVGIYVEAEHKPGAVQRMGPLPLTRTGPADYLLVFIVGQSGWEGYAQRPDGYHDYSAITPAASLMWSRSQAALVPLHDPVGQNFVGGGSPWAAFAKEIETLMKSRAVIVVNCAVGGTKIASDWWSSSTGAQAKWTQALADYDAALDAAHAANLPISGAVVLGDLGEGDGLLGTTAATFKAHMVSWLAAIRTLVNPYVPVFWRPPGRGNTATPGQSAAFAQINKALNELTAEDAYFYMGGNGEAITETRGLMMSDHYHNTLPAQEETGRALAAVTVPHAIRAPKNYTLDVAR